MYCEKCGQEILEDAKFCHSCGSLVTSSRTGNTNTIQSEQITSQVPKTVIVPTDAQSSSYLLLSSNQHVKTQIKPIYVLITLLIICAGLLSYIILTRNKEDKIKNAEKKVINVRDDDRQAITAIIHQWANAWNMKDFLAYKSFYTTDFYGIKRTKSGKTTLYNYDTWMADRNRMLVRALWITVEVNNIVFRSATENEIEVAFEQIYRSNSYSDK